jgi:hypothetical protein
MAQPSPPLRAVGRPEDRRQVHGHDETVGNNIRLNSQRWKDARIIGDRQVAIVVAYKGQLYLLAEHRPAKFEQIDRTGLHEAGYGPEDFE